MKDRRETVHREMVKIIPEFAKEQDYMQYFVSYERPQGQRSLYNFWKKAVNDLVGEILQKIVVTYQEFMELFLNFNYRPLCIFDILVQMHKDERIILVKTNRAEIIKISAQLLNNKYQVAHQESAPSKVIWNYFAKFFQLKQGTERSSHESGFDAANSNQYSFIHIGEFKRIMPEFKQCIEREGLHAHSTFTVSGLLNQKVLNAHQIKFFIKVFKEAKLIEQIGLYKTEFLKENVYIYKPQWDVNSNRTDLDKSITLFKLIYHSERLNEELKGQETNIQALENQIRTKIREGKKPQDVRFEVCQIKLRQKQCSQIQNKLIMLQQNIFALETTESDNQIEEILKRVNEAITKFQVDPVSIREGLDQLQTTKADQEQINDMMMHYTNQDEVEEMFALYQQQIEPKSAAHQKQSIERSVQPIQFTHLQTPKLKIATTSEAHEPKASENKLERVLLDLQ